MFENLSTAVIQAIGFFTVFHWLNIRLTLHYMHFYFPWPALNY